MIRSANQHIGIALVFLIFAASCASHPPPPQISGDVEFLNSSAAGRLAFDSGDFPRAQTLYARALARARAVNEPDSIVDAASNLAICQIAMKNYDAADLLLREAEYDARRASMNPSDIQVLRAKAAYLRGDLSESANLANQVIGSQSDDTLRLSAMILKGQISCESGDLAAARTQLQLIDEFAATLRNPVPSSASADIAKLRGMIQHREHNDEAAARYFDEEAELLRISHRYGDMSHALARSGESYLAVSKPALAADRFFLAARSAAALRDSRVARQWAAASISAAEKAGDTAARFRSNALMKEISEAAGP